MREMDTSHFQAHLGKYSEKTPARHHHIRPVRSEISAMLETMAKLCPLVPGRGSKSSNLSCIYLPFSSTMVHSKPPATSHSGVDRQINCVAYSLYFGR
jgi:hypothetical protein